MARPFPIVAACVAALVALPCAAAQWKQVQKGPEGELWVDNASVKRTKGEVFFEYRIDYPKPQQEVGSKTMYQSTVTKAAVRCGDGGVLSNGHTFVAVSNWNTRPAPTGSKKPSAPAASSRGRGAPSGRPWSRSSCSN